MHVHVMGVAGTLMAGVAQLAKAMGHTVSGCDTAVYPPMDMQLQDAGIEVHDAPVKRADLFVVGNAYSRGHPWVEAMLRSGQAFTSGPAWLQEHVLATRRVCAVAGTHGKTSTTALLAHLLREGGKDPGFLVGGVPENLGTCAHLGSPQAPFVIEADEYDTAYWDKRPKCLHWFPECLILNAVEFDHADIFPDLETIRQHMHYLLRRVPPQGHVFWSQADPGLQNIHARGFWSQSVDAHLQGHDWSAEIEAADGTVFSLQQGQTRWPQVRWPVLGRHQVDNAVRAVAVAHHWGVSQEALLSGLASYRCVARRLSDVGVVGPWHVWDDFAHHPTSIQAVIETLTHHAGQPPVVVAQLCTRSMQRGAYGAALMAAAEGAREVLWYPTLLPLAWSLDEAVAGRAHHHAVHSLEAVSACLKSLPVAPKTPLLLLGNKDTHRLIEHLKATYREEPVSCGTI